MELQQILYSERAYLLTARLKGVGGGGGVFFMGGGWGGGGGGGGAYLI